MKFFESLYINKYYRILLSCIVPLLVFGPFLPDLIISFSVFIFLIFIYKSKKFELLINQFSLYFYLFCLICILSSLLSSDILFSLKSSLPYFRLIIFCHLIAYLIKINKNILKYFYLSCSITFIILCLNGIIEYFFDINVFFKPTEYGNRITSFFYDEKILGSYLSRMFPLYLALSITQIKNFSSNFLSILTILLLFIGTFISGERAAFFFLMISTFIIFIYFNGFTKIKIIFASFIIVTLTFIYSTNPSLKNRMVTETFNSIFKEKENIVIFTQEHDSHIRTALKIFSDSPLLGHGPRMFRIKCQIEEFQVGNTPCNTHPHNFYIQLLAETGILGFSFLFFLLIFSIYRSIKYLYHKFYSSEVFEKYSNFKISLISGIMATIFPLTTNGNFFNNYLMILYFLPLGFLFYSFNESNDDRV